jgi:hypothetical protein
VLKSGSELANLAEAASLFNFNNKAFWKSMETTMTSLLNDEQEELSERLNLLQVSQILRAFAYNSYKFADQTYALLVK